MSSRTVASGIELIKKGLAATRWRGEEHRKCRMYVLDAPGRRATRERGNDSILLLALISAGSALLREIFFSGRVPPPRGRRLGRRRLCVLCERSSFLNPRTACRAALGGRSGSPARS